MLSYSNDKIKELKTNKDDLNKGFIKLIADYLLTKQIISTNSNDLFSSIIKIEDCNSGEESIIKLMKSKNLYQMFRIFQDRQYFNIDFKLNLIKYIKQELLNDTESSNIINILIILPFILNNNEKSEDKYQIIELIEKLLEKLINKDDLFLNELNYFIISILFWSLLIVKSKESLDSKIDNYIDKSIDLFIRLSQDKNEIEKNKCLIHLLRSLDYLFGYKFSNCSSIVEKNDDKMSTAIVYMKHQLSSPYHESRLISLNILTKMLRQVKVKNSVADEDTDDENVLTLCIKAENIKSTIEDYRQKLYFMQRLDFDNSQKLMPSSDFEDV